MEALQNNIRYFLKWTIYSIFTGLVIGSVGTFFRKGVDFATVNRSIHPWFLLFAPLGAIFIVGLTKLLHEEKMAARIR